MSDEPFLDVRAEPQPGLTLHCLAKRQLVLCWLLVLLSFSQLSTVILLMKVACLWPFEVRP